MSTFFTKFPVILKKTRNNLIKSYATASKKKTKVCDSKTSQQSPPKAKKIGFDSCNMLNYYHGNYKPFRLLGLSVLPLIGYMSFNAFSHHEHIERHFVPYDYMYKRLKQIFYGDRKRTFFHGPNNFIPEDEQYDKTIPKPYEGDLNRRKERRNRHAQEELERRRQRRQNEA